MLAQLSKRITDTGTNRHDNIHWLASRVLLQELCPDQKIRLSKDEFNKPHLDINGSPFFVSITHSYAYAAVMISSEHTVAVDLEKIDERVNRVSRKFIRIDEQPAAGTELTLYYTIIWSAKETLYKYYSKKELDFLEHLRIEPFAVKAEPFRIEGAISKEPYSLRLLIDVTLMDGYVLTRSAVR